MSKINKELCNRENILFWIDFIQEYNWKIKNNEFKNLITNQKKIILNILNLINKYNIDISDKFMKTKLLNNMKQSDDLEDRGLANYIESELKGVIAEDDREDLLNMSEDISFFWSASEWWKPLEIIWNLQEVLGYEKMDFYTEQISFSDIIHPDDIQRIISEVENNTKAHLKYFEQEYRLKRKDNIYIYIKDKTICKYNEKWEIIYLYWYIVDITEQRRTEKKLDNTINTLQNNLLINTDNWLPNTKQLNFDLETINNPLLFILKIKNFWEINWEYSFQWWNIILWEIEKKLNKIITWLWYNIYSLNSATTFWVLVDIDDNKKEEIINNINNVIHNFYVDTILWHINIIFSWGCAEWTKDIYDKSLIALYSAKNNEEKSKVQIYSEEIDSEVVNKSREYNIWINKIIDGIENDKFFPVYHWIRNNENNEIDKYEALIRFNDNWKEISPIEFLEYAEKIWKISELTTIMINKVIPKMAGHNKSISINLTKTDLENDDIIALIKKLLIEYNIEPERLTIEILENITLDGDKWINRIQEFKDLWTKIAIDDFGVWYSNFERLVNINADYLKIDWSLIKDIEWNPKKIQLIRMIQDLAKLNNTETIAEFVKNEEIQKIIEMLGIKYSQGYYFAQPEADPFTKENFDSIEWIENT